jgi:hypothetical protein
MIAKIIFRFVFGALAGPLLYVLFRWKAVLRDMSEDQLPTQALLVSAAIGALLLALSTPGLPWRPRE